MTLRDTILAASDLPGEAVHVPEWNVTLTVRSMTAAERDAYEQRMADARKAGGGAIANIRAALVVMCALDAAGGRVFGDDDIEALGAKSARAVDRVFEAAARLNRLRDQDVETAAGNSAGGPDGASPSV